MRFADTGAARGRLEPARLGLPPRRRPVHAASPASSRRWPTGSPRSRAASRARRPCSMRAEARSSAVGGPAGRRGSRPRRRSSSWPASTSSIDEALTRPRRRHAERSGRRRASCPGCAAAAERRGRRSPRFETPPARRGPAGERGRGPARAPSCSPRRCATRCARTTLTPERILAGAEREYAAVRAEMVRLARELWPTWCPGDRPPADDDGALVRGVLDAIAAEHPTADDLLDFCRAENARIEAFCRERDLIGLADEPLEIRWTPVFLRAFGGAMLDLARAARQGPEGVLRDHADARRLADGAARSRTCARTTTGCSGC